MSRVPQPSQYSYASLPSAGSLIRRPAAPVIQGTTSSTPVAVIQGITSSTASPSKVIPAAVSKSRLANYSYQPIVDRNNQTMESLFFLSPIPSEWIDTVYATVREAQRISEAQNLNMQYSDSRIDNLDEENFPKFNRLGNMRSEKEKAKYLGIKFTDYTLPNSDFVEKHEDYPDMKLFGIFEGNLSEKDTSTHAVLYYTSSDKKDSSWRDLLKKLSSTMKKISKADLGKCGRLPFIYVIIVRDTFMASFLYSDSPKCLNYKRFQSWSPCDPLFSPDNGIRRRQADIKLAPDHHSFGFEIFDFKNKKHIPYLKCIADVIYRSCWAYVSKSFAL